MQVLTPEEIQRLLIQAREDGCYELLLLELSTGLRRGEILALQWGDLNFRTGALRVERQVHRVKGELVVSPPKTKGRQPDDSSPYSCFEGLKAIPENRPLLLDVPFSSQGRLAYGPSRRPEKRSDGAGAGGAAPAVPRSAAHLRYRLSGARHGHQDTESAIIGHVSSTTTLNTYTHVTDAMRQSAADKIDRGIGRAEPKPRQEPYPRNPSPAPSSPQGTAAQTGHRLCQSDQ